MAVRFVKLLPLFVFLIFADDCAFSANPSSPMEVMFTMSHCPHPINQITVKNIGVQVFNNQILKKVNAQPITINKKENDVGCKFGLKLLKEIPRDAWVHVDLVTKSSKQTTSKSVLVRETWCDFITYEKNKELYNGIFKGSTFPEFGKCPWPSGDYKQEKMAINEKNYPCNFNAEIYELTIFIFTGAASNFEKGNEKSWICRIKITAEVKPKAVNDVKGGLKGAGGLGSAGGLGGAGGGRNG